MARDGKNKGSPGLGSLFMFGGRGKGKEIVTRPGKYLGKGDIKGFGDFLKVMKRSGFDLNKHGKLKGKQKKEGGELLAPFARLFAQFPGVKPSDLSNAPTGTFTDAPYGPGGGGGGGGGGPSGGGGGPSSPPASTYTPPLSAGTLAVARLIGKKRGM